jgi:metallophosphoesterase superfamily enzyme
VEQDHILEAGSADRRLKDSSTALVADVLAELRDHFSGQGYYAPKQRDEILNKLSQILSKAFLLAYEEH